MQWIKRFWDQNFASDSYDPVARRRGAPVETATVAPVNRALTATSSAAGRGAGRRTPPGGTHPTFITFEISCSSVMVDVLTILSFLSTFYWYLMYLITRVVFDCDGYCTVPRGTVRSGSSAAGYSQEFVNNLQIQLRESVAQMEGLEKERDFYFAKVRHRHNPRVVQLRQAWR